MLSLNFSGWASIWFCVKSLKSWNRITFYQQGRQNIMGLTALVMTSTSGLAIQDSMLRQERIPREAYKTLNSEQLHATVDQSWVPALSNPGICTLDILHFYKTSDSLPPDEGSPWVAGVTVPGWVSESMLTHGSSNVAAEPLSL